MRTLTIFGRPVGMDAPAEVQACLSPLHPGPCGQPPKPVEEKKKKGGGGKRKAALDKRKKLIAELLKKQRYLGKLIAQVQKEFQDLGREPNWTTDPDVMWARYRGPGGAGLVAMQPRGWSARVQQKQQQLHKMFTDLNKAQKWIEQQLKKVA